MIGLMRMILDILKQDKGTNADIDHNARRDADRSFRDLQIRLALLQRERRLLLGEKEE